MLACQDTVPGRKTGTARQRNEKIQAEHHLECVKADGTPLGRLQLALEKLTCTLGMREKKMRTHME